MSPVRVTYKQALKRILRVGTLEEAQQIAEAVLHYEESFTSKIACQLNLAPTCSKANPKLVLWDTCARIEVADKVYNVCDDCLHEFNPNL